MSIQYTTLSPFFLSLFYAIIASVVAAIDYPDQKFVLQRKFSDGTIRKVKTYDRPTSREQVQSEFGPGRYSLKAMKPRITVIWKDGPPLPENANEGVER